MNEYITHLIQNPTEVESSDLSILKKEIEQHPYFYNLRAIQLLALKKENHPSYEDYLHTTSIYSHNRTDLFHFLNKKEEFTKTETVVVKPILAEKAIASEPIDLVKDEIEQVDVKTPFETNIIESEIAVLEELETSVVTTIIEDHDDTDLTIDVIEFIDSENISEIDDYIDEVEKENIIIEQEEGQIEESSVQPNEQPAETISPSSRSFNDWLKSSTVPKHNETVTQETVEKVSEEIASAKEEKLKIINTFIENSPKITPLDKDFSVKQNTSKEPVQSIEITELMTETLAQIYVEQNKYDKAIRAYKILSLKYPEKNTYFADRIKEIENLKNKK